ncbi:hypothetical protein ACHAWF_011383 [Thalassiosira exigua]
MSHYVDQDVVCPGGHGENPGVEGEDGHKVLLKVRGGIAASMNFIRNSINDNPGDAEVSANHRGKGSNGNSIHRLKRNRSKILCLVYTAHMPSKDEHGNLRAQAQTWGRRCDGFIAASNHTDHSIGAIDLPHLGPEEYGNMWQKVRTMWAYAYHHYLDDFDWFNIVGDDVYVVVDNLRAYVDGPEVQHLEEGGVDRIFEVQDSISRPVPKDPENMRNGSMQENRNKSTDQMRPRPLMLGIPMPHFKGAVWFPAGGSGYTLNQAALKLFGKTILTRFQASTKDSREDVFMGSAFDEEGVYVSDTRDRRNASRYLGSAARSARFDGVLVTNPKRQQQRFGIEYEPGVNYASWQAISFHLKDDKKLLRSLKRTVRDSMYRYHTFLYNMTKALCS